jgi:hypothetical protein
MSCFHGGIVSPLLSLPDRQGIKGRVYQECREVLLAYESDADRLRFSNKLASIQQRKTWKISSFSYK